MNDLLLGVIVLLAAVTVVNTLVMATVERRPALLLLRVGATSRQLLSMTACQSVLLTGVGIGLGVAAGAATLTPASRAVTGGWPFVPKAPALVIVGSVLALTMAATLGPAAAILRARER